MYNVRALYIKNCLASLVDNPSLNCLMSIDKLIAYGFYN